MRTAARFGIDLDEHDALGKPHAHRAGEIAIGITPGTICHLTGPSGAGKTTLLRGLAEQLRAGGRRIIEPNHITLRDHACVDCFPCSLDEAARHMATAGLAEARCFLRKPAELSEGERFRLRLALALHTASAQDPAPAVILIDEFAATLDRPTALGVARLLRRGITRSANTAAITATSHDDLDAALHPDQWMHVTPTAMLPRKPRLESGTEHQIHTEPGTADDYQRLARWHYRPGHPAAPVRTLRLRHAGLDETIGVLVAAMPTLNASHRHHAWPGRYSSGDKRRDARLVNTEIRRIARVIIDPRFRGRGLARRLVRAYLDDPCTPCTEAAAVMGAVAGFFQAAGMTAYETPPSPRHARLLDALHHAGLQPHNLATPAAAWTMICKSTTNARLIERELRSWAGASRSTASHASDNTQSLWRRACRSIAGVPIGYAHTSTN